MKTKVINYSFYSIFVLLYVCECFKYLMLNQIWYMWLMHTWAIETTWQDFFKSHAEDRQNATTSWLAVMIPKFAYCIF